METDHEKWTFPAIEHLAWKWTVKVRMVVVYGLGRKKIPVSPDHAYQKLLPQCGRSTIDELGQNVQYYQTVSDLWYGPPMDITHYLPPAISNVYGWCNSENSWCLPDCLRKFSDLRDAAIFHRPVSGRQSKQGGPLQGGPLPACLEAHKWIIHTCILLVEDVVQSSEVIEYQSIMLKEIMFLYQDTIAASPTTLWLNDYKQPLIRPASPDPQLHGKRPPRSFQRPTACEPHRRSGAALACWFTSKVPMMFSPWIWSTISILW